MHSPGQSLWVLVSVRVVRASRHAGRSGADIHTGGATNAGSSLAKIPSGLLVVAVAPQP